MKKIFFAIAMLFSTTISFAQTQSIRNLTTQYLQIKTALANDDATKATAAAAEFSKLVANIPMKDISSTLHPTFMQHQKALIAESKTIASSKDIKAQRKAFMELSSNMIALAKTDKISNTPIYEEYCPMKKASWLNETKEISNPYYGSSMSDCGKVTATY